GGRRAARSAPPGPRPDQLSPAQHPASRRGLRPANRRRPVTLPARVLCVVVCGAGPAAEVGQLVKLALERGWTVQVVSTPAALAFLDATAIEAQTSSPVRSQYRSPGEPRSREADAIIVSPATYNTINKWAQGISDTYAL